MFAQTSAVGVAALGGGSSALGGGGGSLAGGGGGGSSGGTLPLISQVQFLNQYGKIGGSRGASGALSTFSQGFGMSRKHV